MVDLTKSIQFSHVSVEICKKQGDFDVSGFQITILNETIFWSTIEKILFCKYIMDIVIEQTN